MFDKIAVRTNDEIITISVIIAIILGLGTSVFFILIETESYSAIYFVPDSIIHTPNDNTVLYTYGVKSSETRKTDYSLQTYVNTTLIKTKNFTLNKEEILEERDKITLPSDIEYPIKISLNLTTDSETEEIHFWLKTKD
jgi:hypothetical protein